MTIDPETQRLIEARERHAARAAAIPGFVKQAVTDIDPMPYRAYPCDECPIRADNCDNPKSKFPAEKWAELSCSVRNEETEQDPMPWEPMFGCHKGKPGTGQDLACAGWLVRFGSRHTAVRFALASGRLPPEALQAGPNWPPLHETWADVVRHQTSTTEQ